MRVLFVQPQPCIRALKYAEGLRNEDGDIRLSFAYAGRTLSDLYGHGDERFHSWSRLDGDPAAQLREIVGAQGIDLIHSHNGPDRLTNLCIDLFGGTIPIIHDIHDLMSARDTTYEDGVSAADDPTNHRTEEKQAIERSDAVIAVSDEILEISCRHGYRLPEIAHVHPNYIPEHLIPENLPAIETRGADRPIRIVYEGFLSSNGSHYDLREIFRRLAGEGLEIHVYPSRHNADYEGLAEEVPNVRYHGHLPPKALFPELTQYDFGWAGFNDTTNKIHLGTVLPNKLFEYIACGLPVISFPQAALRRFLTTQGMGIVIESIAGLGARLRDPEMIALRQEVRARRRDFTVERNIGAIVEIYRRLCQADRNGAAGCSPRGGRSDVR